MGQIVWFFGKPTVLVCPECEVVASYYTDTTCRTCGGPFVHFTASLDAIEQASAEREANGPPAQPRPPARLLQTFAAGWDAKKATDYDDDSGFDEAVAAFFAGGDR